MNRKLVAVLTFCAALLVAGCPDDLVDDLAERQFVLQSAQGFQQLPGTTVNLGFQKRELGFSAGCNSMFGDYRIEDDVLVVTSVGSTLIGCGIDRSRQDDWLSGFISSRPTVTLAENTLTLTSTTATLVFVDREVADPDRPLVGPTWTVDTFISGEFATSLLLAQPARFTFASDGTFQVGTGCNAGAGKYRVTGDVLTLSDVSFDEAACADNAGESDRLIKALFGGGRLAFVTDARRLTLKAETAGLSATTP